MAKTKAQLVTAIRQLTNTENGGSVSDAEVKDRVDEACLELYDLLTDSFEGYNNKTFDFTLTGNTVAASTVALPADTYKVLGLDRDPDTTRARTVRRLASFYERNSPDNLSYDLDGANLMVYTPARAAGNYRLHYVQLFTGLADDSTTLTQPMATWELYVELHAAMVILDKREMDSSSVANRLSVVKQRVTVMARRRDVEPKQVARVRRRSYDY